MQVFFLRFLDSDADLGAAMSGVYDPFLVALSVLMAALAGYAALLITERIASSETPRARTTWLVAGAIAMGSGIWTMHFIGMLAFDMSMPVAYDPWLTGASMAPGILASGRCGTRPTSIRCGIGWRRRITAG